MRRPLFLALIALAIAATAPAHDIITTPITWDREIIRIVYSHCASCHREGGSAFSLMTYKESRPWAEAIKEETLAHTMPPWGAVKGFGDFRNDQALTPEQIEVIVSWADGGVPEGEDKDLPKMPDLSAQLPAGPPKSAPVITGEYKLKSPLKLDGLWPQTVPEKASIQITAELPDGSIQPLVWLEDYKPKYAHPFLFREPHLLPAGTLIHGVPPGASVVLLKPTSTR